MAVFLHALRLLSSTHTRCNWTDPLLPHVTSCLPRPCRLRSCFGRCRRMHACRPFTAKLKTGMA